MSDTHDAHPTTEDASQATGSGEVRLTFDEARILGCLFEKERTTPAEYPLTANALMRACNQSTSRQPVVAFDEHTVESALAQMKVRGLVRFVHSQSNRATKYRHVVDETWSLAADEIAVLCLLLLRGPQTPGEIRTRADRLHAFDSLAAVERTLIVLAQEEPSMVLELERAPGQKERRWVQLLTGAPTAEDLAVVAVGGARSAPGQAVDDALLRRIDALEHEVARLRAVLEELAGPIGD